MAYTDTHESTIQAIISKVDGKVYCIEHAIEYLFDGDEEMFEKMDDGRDTSFRDKHGDPYTLIHSDSFQFDTTGSWYPEGLYCEVEGCGAELIPPEDHSGDDDEGDDDDALC